jgi:hypothetical protein
MPALPAPVASATGTPAEMPIAASTAASGTPGSEDGRLPPRRPATAASGRRPRARQRDREEATQPPAAPLSAPPGGQDKVAPHLERRAEGQLLGHGPRVRAPSSLWTWRRPPGRRGTS